MIKVMQEKIETVTEEFGLIELDSHLREHRICLRVPITTTEEEAGIIQRRSDIFLGHLVAPLSSFQ